MSGASRRTWDRIVEQRRVVGAYVEAHRQRQRGVQPCRGGVERQLAGRYAHAAGAEVAKSQNPLVVGHHDQPDIGLDLTKHLDDAATVLWGNPTPTTAPEDVAEVAAGQTDRRRVDDRHQLVETINQEPVEQGLVPILKVGELDVLAERMLGVLERLDLARQLLFDVDQPGWEQTFEAQLSPFARRECRAFVDQRIAEHIAAALDHVRGDGVVGIPYET